MFHHSIAQYSDTARQWPNKVHAMLHPNNRTVPSFHSCKFCFLSAITTAEANSGHIQEAKQASNAPKCCIKLHHLPVKFRVRLSQWFILENTQWGTYSIRSMG